MKIQTWLKQNYACSEGAMWAKDKASFKEVWDSCQRPDWMLWGLARIGYKDERKLRLYGCACVRGTPITRGRTVWDLLTDERSRRAVEVSERFANGEATEEERAAAWAAAWDAAWVWQSDKLRELVPWIEVEKAIRNRNRKAKP